MTRYIAKYLAWLGATALIFVLAKCAFMLAYAADYAPCGAGGMASAIARGLPMDLSMAGYIAALPALGLIAAPWISERATAAMMRVYAAAISAALALLLTMDTALYGHWGFKLDMTPVFYFLSSPSAVIGGLSASQAIGALAGWAIGAAAIYAVYSLAVLRIRLPRPAAKGARARISAAMAVCAALLIIPIRGGFTVSTMNPSKAYFSQNPRLNHAALNPVFNLLYSASHPAGKSGAYDFFDADGLAARKALIMGEPRAAAPDTARLSATRPDIYLIILESFSTHLMKSLGGEAIAPNLDSIAAAGYIFTNAYANSFRTDRALPSIMSAYPGIPSTSVMKYVDKLERLPSLPRRLKQAGYEPAYYYGGDINFTNMQAYLVSGGFEKIVRDADFPLSQRLGKWGAHDDTLFAKAKADAAAGSGGKPALRVIQTSSSHEPFEVPYRSRWADPAANAFAFADSVLGDFMRHLAASPRWDSTLVAIVPDHYGAYPRGLESLEARHSVPIILSGGALKARGSSDAPASQADIAATLLGMLGLPHGEFTFSHDLFDPDAPRMAYFARPEEAEIITPEGKAAINTVTGATAPGSDPEAADMLRAYLQLLQQAFDKP